VQALAACRAAALPAAAPTEGPPALRRSEAATGLTTMYTEGAQL
jgi:hypothetical protein